MVLPAGLVWRYSGREAILRHDEPEAYLSLFGSIPKLCVAIPWVCLVGCKPVDPAPEDLDGLLHFLWDHVDEGEDATLLEGVQNLHVVVNGQDLESVLEGEVTTLSVEDVAHLETSGDPQDAAGVVITKAVQCTGDMLQAILTHEEQDELYVGVYRSYEREMTSSAA